VTIGKSIIRRTRIDYTCPFCKCGRVPVMGVINYEDMPICFHSSGTGMPKVCREEMIVETVSECCGHVKEETLAKYVN